MTYDYMKTRIADVSHWQGYIDFNTMKSRGIEGVFIKCTQGNWYYDPRFDTNWRTATDAGLLRAPYHYVEMNVSAENQIAWFVSHFNNRDADLPVVLDCEDDFDQSPEKCTNVIKRCCDLLEGYGYGVMIYTSQGWWNPNVQRRDYWKDYPLWVANYTSASAPAMPADWQDWMVWQYTSKGDGDYYGVSSQSVDLNRVHYEWFLDVDDDDDNENGGIDVDKLEELQDVVEYLEGVGAPYSVMVNYHIPGATVEYVDDGNGYEPPEEPGNGGSEPPEEPAEDGEWATVTNYEYEVELPGGGEEERERECIVYRFTGWKQEPGSNPNKPLGVPFLEKAKKGNSIWKLSPGTRVLVNAAQNYNVDADVNFWRNYGREWLNHGQGADERYFLDKGNLNM